MGCKIWKKCGVESKFQDLTCHYEGKKCGGVGNGWTKKRNKRRVGGSENIVPTPLNNKKWNSPNHLNGNGNIHGHHLLRDDNPFFKLSSLEMDTWFSSHHLWRFYRDGAVFFKASSPEMVTLF